MSKHLHGRPARVRAVLGTVTVALLAAATLAATPGTAPASGATAAMPATTARTTDDVSAQALPAGAERFWNHSSPPPFYRAHATIVVHRNHAKVLTICDHYARDSIGLAIEIDPSGTPAPLVYWDKNGPGNSCTTNTIGYSVRKWRFISVYQDGSIHNRAHPWEVEPLPWPDF